eukprot:gnl/MRDRNA2_/MRDRNA2_116370_c0_seq1.p1 gnl/MRDRNA2_/MRDRNA2_116370_c0~~gnl/MRDRNA2_/MRDRNA2_116370_c0_seq1.p1  ORF type:complete len:320 (+),score=73.31 gnl/MRDRNA2_/MRDRNA2_116370_c0_seq1:115-1074(+)
MRALLFTLFFWPEVSGHNYDKIPGFEKHNELDLKHFGSAIEMMMHKLPEWQQKIAKSLIPKEKDFHYDPRVEALHPENELSVAAKAAIEKYYGEKLEEDPAEGTQKLADPVEVSPENSDQPPVSPIEHQTEDEEEDNFIWLAVGGIALGAAAVWVWSTRSRQPILNVDGEDVSLNAGYAKIPERRKQPSRAISDSESSGADRASRSTGGSDIYSSIRRSLQDSDPSTVWKSVRESFSADAGAGNSPGHPSESVRQQYSQQPGTAETSSVSHTDSEEEITEVYDRVKKSLKNLNLLPRKSQELTKDMPPPKGGSSGSSYR